MTIEQKPFRKYRLDDQGQRGDVFAVRLNADERAIINACVPYLQQKRDSTILKDLAMIGAACVLQDQKIAVFLSRFFINKRNNDILGVKVPEPEIILNVIPKKAG